RPRTRARDVGAAAARVDERPSLLRQHRLAPEHVAPRAVRRGVVLDGERAEDRRRLLLAVTNVRLLADEVRRLHTPPRHPGLDDVVIGVELEAERAIALLEAPGRAVDADSGRHDPV